MSDQIHYGFQFGNVSRKVLGNIDQSYYTRCFVEGENFIGTLQGSLTKRPGIKAVFSEEIENWKEYRIFQAFYQDISYILRWVVKESGDTFFRVFAAEDGTPATDEQSITNFTGLDKLSFAFKDNFGIFTHPDFQPLFYGDSDNAFFRSLTEGQELTLIRYPNFFGPLLDQNLDVDITLSSDSNPLVGGTATITSSSAIFLPKHLSSVWGVTEALGTLGAYIVWKEGTAVNVGDFRRNDGKVYQAQNSGTTGNIPPTHDADKDIQSDGAVRWLFCNDGIGYFKISEVVSSTEVKALIQRRLPDTLRTTPSYRWNEAAWSGVRGYPSVVTLFEQRLAFAATDFEGDRVWATNPGKDFSFLSGSSASTVESTDAVAYPIPVGGKIQWILGSREFIVGGRRRIQELNGLSAATILTQLRNGVEDGSAGNQAFYIDNLLAYVGAKRDSLRLLIYRDEYQGYSPYNPEFLNPGAMSDLSQIAPLTQPKTVVGLKSDNTIGCYQLDLQRAIDGVYNILNDNLKFVSLTSDRTKAFIVANNGDDDILRIGTFDPEAEGSDYLDYGTYEYEASMRFPPPTSWTPPVYAGSLKKIYSIYAHLRFLDSGTFFFEGTQINAKRTTDPFGKFTPHSGEAAIPISSNNGGNGPKIVSPSGQPLTIAGALFSFAIVENTSRRA